MIEFNGYLTGAAEKHFYKQSRIIGQRIILLSALLVAPGILSFATRNRNLEIVVFFVVIFLCIMLLVALPKSNKEKKKIIPHKIIISDEYIVCVAEKYTETKLIADVKQVKDFGEYYELCFRFGKMSEKFICQKSLLVKGTIQEFETLFNSKVRKTG